MRRLCLALPLAGLALTPLTAPAMADDLTDQLELAIELYQEGDFSGAITELKFAIGEIESKLGEVYGATFPPAPAGWSAEAATQEGGAAFMGGGTIVSRRYSETGGPGSMTAQLIIDNPMIQGMAALFGNPALLAANPNMKRIRMGRESATLDFDDSEGRGEVTFMAGGRAMLKVEGHNLSSGDQLVELLKAWDMDGLKAAAGL